MNDREIFKDNLKYYLAKNKMQQKDLAEAIGAKYTTVSGWTRGVSYPRADAMEKIARCFNIPTSKLVGHRDGEPEEKEIRSILIPDSELFRKLILHMNYNDYKTIMDILERTEEDMRRKGVF